MKITDMVSLSLREGQFHAKSCKMYFCPSPCPHVLLSSCPSKCPPVLYNVLLSFTKSSHQLQTISVSLSITMVHTGKSAQARRHHHHHHNDKYLWLVWPLGPNENWPHQLSSTKVEHQYSSGGKVLLGCPNFKGGEGSPLIWQWPNLSIFFCVCSLRYRCVCPINNTILTIS